MKNFIIILSLLLSITVSASAQSVFNKATSKSDRTVVAGGHSYKYSRIGESFIKVEPSSTNLNTNKVQSEKSSIPYPDITYIKLKHEKGLLNSFRSVFNESRLHQLLPERNLVLMFDVDGVSGKILHVTYLLKHNTGITPAELDKLDTQLKKNVVYVLSQGQVAGRKTVDITQNVTINKILDNTSALHSQQFR